MSRIVKKWPLSPNNEIIWMGFIGMGLTAIEESCVDLQESLYYIWTQTFPYDSFSEEIQEIIKSILSGIVLVRRLTVHLYFFSYFAMLMMVMFEEVPILALPWLAVSLIRNFLLDMLAFLTGIFICIRYALAPVCYEFILYKTCEMGVSIYLWVSVLKLSQDISFPDISPGDMVLTRAECIPRRPKEQEAAEEVEVGHKHLLNAEEEEEEEEEYDVHELEDDEAPMSAGEDQGVQVSTLSRKFLKQAARELGNTPDEEPGGEGPEEAEVSSVSEQSLTDASEKPEQTTGEKDAISAPQKTPDADEVAGIKSEGTQVDLLSKEFLAQAEESASNNKWNVEVQVNTVSYKFLNEEAEKIGLLGRRL